jgi:hypothetical protein
MQNSQDNKSGKEKFSNKVPSFTKPVWGNQGMSCEECKYNDQDIDTFPCAKCHTRH